MNSGFRWEKVIIGLGYVAFEIFVGYIGRGLSR